MRPKNSKLPELMVCLRYIKDILTSQNLDLLLVPQVTFKDSFVAANRIKNILPHLFDDGYNLLSLALESLFTNVSIKITIDIIFKRIYVDKVLSTNLKKSSMKKVLLDTCNKTVFTFNGIMYEQRDGCMHRI